MSFKCEVCGCAQPAGVSPHRRVVEHRNKIYEPVKNPDGMIKKVPEGWEIVKEVSICGKCY